MKKNICFLFMLVAVVGWYVLLNKVSLNKKQEKSIETTPVEKCISELRLVQYGVASWYNYDLTNYKDYGKFNSTCASRFFERGTMLKVKNIKNGKEVICRVNDYIEHPERVIDLSQFAFSQIENLDIGLADVEITLANN